jgi:DNA invertase Pin-like site-specific DNA recombinase
MIVVSYIRVSSRGQLDGDGPERQREAIGAFVGASGLLNHHEFCEAVTGTLDGLDRPIFSEMLSYIDKHPEEIGGIVVERMDRLARDLMVSEVLLAQCRKRKLKVFAADQGALIDMASDGGDPTRVLIRQIMGALAQWEKSQLVKKLKLARERKKERAGRCEGMKPFGAYQAERQILEFIRNMTLNGKLSQTVIARCLNDGGFRNRRGGLFSRQNIEQLTKIALKNI